MQIVRHTLNEPFLRSLYIYMYIDPVGIGSGRSSVERSTSSRHARRATNAPRYDFTAGGSTSCRRQLAFSLAPYTVATPSTRPSGLSVELVRGILERAKYSRGAVLALGRRGAYPWPKIVPRFDVRYHSAGTSSNNSSWLRVSDRDSGEINYRRDASARGRCNKTTLSNATFGAAPG